MRKLYAILLSCLFLSQSVYGAFSGATKTKTITKFRIYLSSYLSAAQYTTLFNQIEQDFYNQASISTIGSSMVARIMAVLSFSQILQFGSLGLTLGIDLTNAINVLMNVAYNNLSPFYTGQVLPQVAANKAKGMTFNGICNNNYRFINEFYTLNRSKTIMNRVKAGFSTSDWTAIRTKLASLIQFAVNGV